EWVHVQLHQQKGMISLSPPTICNSAAMNNPRFPVDVLKARLKRDPLLALELVNPELDLVRQLALNGKTRAIREQAMRKLDELY
ncbi:DUF2773 domain-containing protein, partial [Escherichia coli]